MVLDWLGFGWLVLDWLVFDSTEGVTFSDLATADESSFGNRLSGSWSNDDHRIKSAVPAPAIPPSGRRVRIIRNLAEGIPVSVELF